MWLELIERRGDCRELRREGEGPGRLRGPAGNAWAAGLATQAAGAGADQPGQPGQGLLGSHLSWLNLVRKSAGVVDGVEGLA